MSKISLWFSQDYLLQLEGTLFVQEHINLKQHCVRGSLETASNAGCTFRWSRAVQALCILLLRSRAQQEQESPYLLQGEHHSPASSLDYALSKEPRWLQDMFGTDAQGHSYARCLIIRRNPERKRPGPVCLSLNQKSIGPRDIRVFVDQEEIVDPQRLQALSAKLELAWKAVPRRQKAIILERSKRVMPPPQLFHPAGELLRVESAQGSQMSMMEWEQRYLYGLKIELQLLFNCRDIFNPQKTNDWLQRTREESLFSKLCGKELKRLSSFGVGLSGAERLGMTVDERDLAACLMGDKPFVFVIAGLGSVLGAILLYLKHSKGYNIEIISDVMYSPEIMDRVLSGSFPIEVAGCCLNMGTAARMMARGRRAEFEPFLLIPYHSERIVLPRKNNGKAADLSRGEWLFLVDPPGTSLFHYLSFVAKGLIRKERNPCCHIQEDLITSRLMEKDSDIRPLLQFPNYLFNVWYNDGVFPQGPLGEVLISDSLLFLHRSVLVDKNKARYLEIAVRDAWIELKQGGGAFDEVLTLISRERGYLKNLGRYTGLHYLLDSSRKVVAGRKGFDGSKILCGG